MTTRKAIAELRVLEAELAEMMEWSARLEREPDPTTQRQYDRRAESYFENALRFARATGARDFEIEHLAMREALTVSEHSN